MKFFLDQLPFIAFVVAFVLPASAVQAILGSAVSAEAAQSAVAYLFPNNPTRSLYLASILAIIAAFLQAVIHRIVYGQFKTSHLVVFGLFVIFGGATLLLHDQRFIMWKPTAVYWILAAALFGSQFIGDKPLVERAMEHLFSSSRRVWLVVNRNAAIFFVILGAINLYVAKRYSETVWWNFKLYGAGVLVAAFIMAQFFYLHRHGELRDQD
jgi:intracellular septation protein